MEIKTLKDTSLEIIHASFIKAFSDYQEPMEMSLESFVAMMERYSLDLSLSVGAFIDESLVSFILVGRRGNRVYDAGTATIREFRRQKIASKLFKYQMQILSKNDISEYILECIDTNEKAMNLYESKGFSIIRHLDCYRVSKIEAEDMEIEEAPLQDAAEIEEAMLYKPSWQNSYQSYKNDDSFHLYKVGKTSVVVSERGVVSLINAEDIDSCIAILSHALKQSKTGGLRIINIDRENKQIKKLMVKIGAELFVSQVEMNLFLNQSS